AAQRPSCSSQCGSGERSKTSSFDFRCGPEGSRTAPFAPHRRANVKRLLAPQSLAPPRAALQNPVQVQG
ncbi:hypothetical protein, partial [Puniceibacterium confluentis]|uniref:hypothetical protein n=1 Tax=Puniceibacterium confluentis TaxID=1958944 RepID=UPI003567268F